MVETETYSVDEKIEHIQQLMEKSGSVAWADIFRRCSGKMELVCSFLAILELCRMGMIRAHQHIVFGNIRIFRSVRTDVA